MMPAGKLMAGACKFFADHDRRGDKILIGNIFWCLESKLGRSSRSPADGN